MVPAISLPLCPACKRDHVYTQYVRTGIHGSKLEYVNAARGEVQEASVVALCEVSANLVWIDMAAGKQIVEVTR